ncbi:hypothetical protein V6615_12980 [Oscillospiraceae bacterium PP1C4]
MKGLSKKFMSMLLALVMVLSIGVTASAASSSIFSVEVQKGKIIFIQNGKAVGTFLTKNSNVTLTTDSEEDFLVCYYDTNDKYRSITLGDQKSLSIKGTMTSLTVSKNLDATIKLTLAPASNVAIMKISSPNDVTIQGKVGTLSVAAAADVTISSSAKVSQTTITDKKAVITTEKGASVGKTTAKAPAKATKPAAPAKKPAAKKSNSNSQITLKTKAIYAESGDTLSDLIEDLNDNVEAYDKATDDYMSGTAEWTSTRRSELDDDGTFGFVFTPDEAGYNSIRGSIKVYVDTAHGDITIHIENPKQIDAKDGDKLKEYNNELDDMVWAEDDDGDEVEGKAKFNSSSTTLDSDRDREYEFTFTPRSSKYNKEKGDIYVNVT